LCCNSFQVGADMSGADFGLDGDLKGQFKAFAQASSDLSVVANGALTDVAVACENIARDLGAKEADVQAAAAKSGADQVKALCALATAQIKAKFGASGELKATLAVDFQPPVCTASIDAQASCQGSCSVDAKCDADVAPPKCTGGKLTVECSGKCEASGGVDVSCTGTCGGSCSGSCTAEAGATIDCEGTCEGSCTVDGKAGSASGVQADGTCKGKCDGKCTMAADAKVECKGTCEGKCDAACEAKAGVKFTCDGKCTGTAEAPKCEGGKAEVDCDVDADCKANCSASASAKADCKPPALAVTATVSGTASVDAQAQIDAAVASLKANLPNLIVVVKARGAAFKSGIEASVSAGGKITANAGDLSGEAVFCALPIANAIGKASTDFAAALSASVDVTASVGVK
ncbi:MAG TPA: hypothetical protein VEQ59_16490, partial [Polyangiaceae bacterium]|nr:hypothetical protein [Polyangiaceae bacterium]